MNQIFYNMATTIWALKHVLFEAGTKVGPDQLGPASPGRINSDRLGSTRIMKKNIKLEKTETFTHLKAKIPVNNGPN